jgi:hypothetical protein
MSFESAALTERLCRQNFVTGAADETRFHELEARVRGLARPGEVLDIPEINGAGAYRRLHDLFLALDKRERQETTKSASADLQLASLAAEINRRWMKYGEDRTWLLEFQQRNRGEFALLCEWTGLTDDDMASPIPPADSEHAPYGRFPNWESRAGRVGQAVQKLRSLSPEMRAKIPGEIEVRRLKEALRAHDRDLETLFDVVHRFAQRLEAAESRLPAEIREAADAAA